MKEKLLYVLIVFFGIFCYSQNYTTPAIGYFHAKDLLTHRQQKKVDELSKCPESKDKNVEVFCCHVPIEVHFKKGGASQFRLLLRQYLRFPADINFGENTFTFTIKRNGKIGEIKIVKESDKRIGKVLKNTLRKDIFQNWSPASYYGIKVRSKITMSIYVDTDYSRYNIQ